MGLRRPNVMKERLESIHTFHGTTTLPFVIPSVPGFPTSQLSTGPLHVVLPKENHMQLTEVATLDRKSGEAEESAVPRTFRRNTESHPQTKLSSRPERSIVERSAVSFSRSHTPATNPGCPTSPISCGAWWVHRTLCAFPLKKGAHAGVSGAAYRKFGASRSFFARCGIPQPPAPNSPRATSSLLVRFGCVLLFRVFYF
jgi:hypothetical protein